MSGERGLALIKKWNDYWFRPAPLINLAITRIVVVLFQLVYLLVIGFRMNVLAHARLPDTLFAPLPILRALTFPFGGGFRPGAALLDTIFWITLAAGVLAVIGLKTRPSLFVFAFGNAFLQAFLFSFGDFHHPQALMILALFILALGPSGEVLSLDDFFRRQSVESLEGGPGLPAWERFGIFASWPLLLVQWLYALIYMSAAINKLVKGGPGWLNGYTLQYYLLQDGLRWGSSLGVAMSQIHLLALGMSLVTVLFEGTFFLVLFFPRLWLIYIPLGFLLHTGIYLTMRAPFPQWIVIYAVFVPWRSIIRRLALRFRGESWAKQSL